MEENEKRIAEKEHFEKCMKLFGDKLHLFHQWEAYFSSPDHMKSWLSEEVGELLVATHHYYRGRVGAEAVSEEIVDVMICMAQLAISIMPHDFYGMLASKLEKAEKRMAKEPPPKPEPPKKRHIVESIFLFEMVRDTWRFIKWKWKNKK